MSNERVPRQKVRWTSDEMAFLARETARLHLQDPSTSLLTQLNKVIQQLPKDRRRTVKTWVAGRASDVQRVLKEIKDALAEATTAKGAVDSEVQSPTQAVSFIAKETEYREQVTQIVDGDELLGRPSLALLAYQFVSGLEDLLAKKTVSTTSAPLCPVSSATATEPHSTVSIPARVRLPKIVLVGLLSNQGQDIQRAFRGKAEVIVISKDRQVRGLPDADWYLLAQNFISHAEQQAILSSHDRQKVLVVKGSASGFIAVIDQLLNRPKLAPTGVNGTPH